MSEIGKFRMSIHTGGEALKWTVERTEGDRLRTLLNEAASGRCWLTVTDTSGRVSEVLWTGQPVVFSEVRGGKSTGF